MSKETIRLRVPISDTWDAGDRLQVFSDFGGGEIDTDRPLLARPVEVFAGQWPAKGLGRQPLGVGRLGDGRASRARTGLGKTILGVTPCGTTPPYLEVVVEVPAAFGNWKFAAAAVDRFGTVQAGSLQEVEAVVSATDPAPLQRIDLADYDGETDVVTFDLALNAE